MAGQEEEQRRELELTAVPESQSWSAAPRQLHAQTRQVQTQGRTMTLLHMPLAFALVLQEGGRQCSAGTVLNKKAD